MPATNHLKGVGRKSNKFTYQKEMKGVFPHNTMKWRKKKKRKMKKTTNHVTQAI